MGLWSDLKKEYRKIRKGHATTHTITLTVTPKVIDRVSKPEEVAIRKSYIEKIAQAESYVHKIASSQNIPEKIAEPKEMLHRLFPNNDADVCPNCKHSFGTPLNRGKTCPVCHTKLHVKLGYLLSDEDEKKYNHAYSEFRKINNSLYTIEHINQMIGYEVWRYYEYASQLAQVYEDLGAYSEAWDCFSGKTIRILDGNRIEAEEPDDYLRVYLWRAEFLERCFRNKVWKVTVEWAAQEYINVIASAYNLGIIKKAILSPTKAIEKIKSLRQNDEIDLNKIKELIDSQNKEGFGENEKNALFKEIQQ